MIIKILMRYTCAGPGRWVAEDPAARFTCCHPEGMPHTVAFGIKPSFELDNGWVEIGDFGFSFGSADYMQWVDFDDIPGCFDIAIGEIKMQRDNQPYEGEGFIELYVEAYEFDASLWLDADELLAFNPSNADT